MMGPDPKILDDIARVAGGAVNILSGLQSQISDEIKSRIEEMADRLDLVPRQDYERLETMVVKLRMQQDDMEKRLAKLEGKKPAPTTAKKTATSKTAKKAAKAPVKKKAVKKAPAKKTAANKTAANKNKKTTKK